MNILLPRMELEHKNEPIECYSSIFPYVLESVGLSCIRWSERLIPLFAEYIMHSYSTRATVMVSYINLHYIIMISLHCNYEMSLFYLAGF